MLPAAAAALLYLVQLQTTRMLPQAAVRTTHRTRVSAPPPSGAIAEAAVAAPSTPAASCPPLGPPLIRHAASSNSHGAIVVTFANAASADFASNWLEHLRRLGLRESALVGATDGGARRALAGVGCFSLASEIGAAEAKWGSKGFSQMGRTKAALLRALLDAAGFAFLLFADADAVFLRDPLPYLARHLELAAAGPAAAGPAAAGAGSAGILSDILFHTDGFGSSHEAIRDGGLERASFGWAAEVNRPHL